MYLNYGDLETELFDWKCDCSDNSGSASSDEENDNSEPEENSCMDRPHKLTFKRRLFIIISTSYQ